MTNVNDVIKENKIIFMYALLHGFHEKEVSFIGQILLLDFFRICHNFKDSSHV